MNMALFSLRGSLLKEILDKHLLINHKLFTLSPIQEKTIHTSSVRSLFFESDPKSGYGEKYKTPSLKEVIRDGLQTIREEIDVWKSEIQDTWSDEHLLKGMPGVVDKLFQFKHERELNKWIVTSDKDNDEGESVCTLSVNSSGKAVFSGNLSLEVPKDGVLDRTGYCNIRCLRAKRSFQRDTHYDWGMYTHLVMRVRGDGRSYALHLSTSSYFDNTWNDIYTYVLFTRGGPYWQYSRIPFSKFFFTSKGRIQDAQFPVPLTHIASLGITLSERAPGPFRLEIDFIGLENDPSHTEEFAYEMYKLPYNRQVTSGVSGQIPSQQ